MIKAKSIDHIMRNLGIVDLSKETTDFAFYVFLTPSPDERSKDRKYFYGRIQISSDQWKLIRKWHKETFLWFLQEIDLVRNELKIVIEEWIDGRQVWITIPDSSWLYKKQNKKKTLG